MLEMLIGATVVLSCPLQERTALTPEVRVRVVDRETGKGVPHAAVDVYAAEVVVADDWNSPYVGDSVFRTLWGDVGRLSVEADGDGVVVFADGLGSVSQACEVLILTSGGDRRGARIVKVDSESPATDYEVVIGPRRSVDVVVVDSERRPCAGVPVEFGRFVHGREPRHPGEGDEQWDALGLRGVTDESGRVTLDELELHGAERLDELRGLKVDPFGARALIYGKTRAFVPVDPEALPASPPVIQLPPCGRVGIQVVDFVGRGVSVDGDCDVQTKLRVAPGSPALVEVEDGRGELFPVERSCEGDLTIEATIDWEPRLVPRQYLPMGDTISPVWGYENTRLRSGATRPKSASGDATIELRLPHDWFTATVRLLSRERKPAANERFEWGRTVVLEDGEEDAIYETEPITTDAEGRITLLAQRPRRPGKLGVAFSQWIDGENRLVAKVPVVFGSDLHRIDLGDVVLTSPELAPIR